MNQAGLCVGWTTVDSESAAVELARALVEQGLAACVQIEGPIRSVYSWEGRICDDAEWRLMLKFSAERCDALHAKVLELHPYETPEWVVVRADAVDARYLAWAQGASAGEC